MPTSTNPVLSVASARRVPGSRGSAGQNLRVSDADRAALADELSRHYSHGRLDQEEFSRRLDQAMAARTYQDVAGLLYDLPPDGSPVPSAGPVRRSARPDRQDGPTRPDRKHWRRRLAAVALVVILLAVTLHTAVWMLGSVLWILIVTAIVVLVVRRRSRRW